MFGGLDLGQLYSQSGPALQGFLILVAVLAWKDARRLFREVKADANEAVEEAAQAKKRADGAVEEVARHEVLIDQNAGAVDDLEDAAARNDQRIAEVRERQAANWGTEFTRGGGNGTRDAAAEPDAGADRNRAASAETPSQREDS